MFTINPTLYEKLGVALVESIGSSCFYSDSITIEEPDVDYRFTASLMIYHSSTHYPEGYESSISDIVPIWWEMHTTTDDGEVLNDFDLNCLKRVICN